MNIWVEPIAQVPPTQPLYAIVPIFSLAQLQAHIPPLTAGDVQLAHAPVATIRSDVSHQGGSLRSPARDEGTVNPVNRVDAMVQTTENTMNRSDDQLNTLVEGMRAIDQTLKHDSLLVNALKAKEEAIMKLRHDISLKHMAYNRYADRVKAELNQLSRKQVSHSQSLYEVKVELRDLKLKSQEMARDLEAKDVEVRRLNEVVEAKEVELVKDFQELSEKDVEITELKDTVKEKNVEIEQLKEKLRVNLAVARELDAQTQQNIAAVGKMEHNHETLKNNYKVLLDKYEQGYKGYKERLTAEANVSTRFILPLSSQSSF